MFEELHEAQDKYYNVFGGNFPMFQLGRSREPEEVIKIIDRCIRENKDVYELGYLSLDNDWLY